MEQKQKDTIQAVITPFILEKVTISNSKEILKTGKLVNFSMEDFRLIFTLEVDGKNRVIELPFPFKFKQTENSVSLSYQSDDFIEVSARSKNSIETPNKSKIKDTIVTIFKV